MAQKTLENRVALLEQEVGRLQFELAQQKGAVSGRTAPDFLDKYVGIFSDDPLFEEMTRRIEASRDQERREAEAAQTGTQP